MRDGEGEEERGMKGKKKREGGKIYLPVFLATGLLFLAAVALGVGAERSEESEGGREGRSEGVR